MSRDTFSTYSPIINFLFFIGALVCGMFFIHPLFLACSVAGAAAYYITIRGAAGFKLIAGLLPLWIFMSILNPLLNTQGERVLFTYFDDRPYTLEALYYGMALGAMFIAIILWFSCYNAVMSSDKFMHLFGRLAPSMSLVFTMVLRLVPSYSRKARQIAAARKCIGKSAGDGEKMEQAENGLTIVSALTSWALEGGIITADSMRSRGYGCGKRSTFSVYRFESRDKLLLLTMAALLTVVTVFALQGAMAVTYTPQIYITGFTGAGTKDIGFVTGRLAGGGLKTLMGAISYGTFLFIPTILNIREVLLWNRLRSKI